MAQVYLQNINNPINVSNIFCIGRNYAAHAAEMGSNPTETPMVFLKPTSAIATEKNSILLPSFSKEIHYETELVVLIGSGGKNIAEADALKHVAGYAIGLDLTARDLQSQAKTKGHPWLLSKGFDNSACVSPFIDRDSIPNPNNVRFSMQLNGELKQQANTASMLFSVPTLICYLSQVFTLTKGDLIFTGTPEGVGPLKPGDHIRLNLADKLYADFNIDGS
jgi:2-keto-4-pentenoate hydratase/2-oxohepta-3-ene-1,7-dioic acid hydratase in catechol pathway